MTSTSDYIEQDRLVLQGFFQERVNLKFYDMRSTYCTFKVTALNGMPAKHDIIVSFYNDLTYTPMDFREGYAGKLVILDKDVPSRSSYACAETKLRTDDCSNPRYGMLPSVSSTFSFVEKLKEAYMYDSSSRGISRNGRSEREAEALLAEAFGNSKTLDHPLDDPVKGSKDQISLRDPNCQDKLAVMTCWHDRYSLGDEHSFSTPRDFLIDLAGKTVSYQEFFRFVQEGGTPFLRLAAVYPETHLGPHGQEYVLQFLNIDEAWGETGCLISEEMERVSGQELPELLDYLDRVELQKLLSSSNNVIMMPLYLYDHSGITISTSSFIGRVPYAKRDSAQVGYIHMTKDLAMDNFVTPTDSGYKRIDEENWKTEAEQYMRAEVSEYDNYLTSKVKLKLSVSDLNPNRDYTIEELAELAKQKTARKNITDQQKEHGRKPPDLGL